MEEAIEIAINATCACDHARSRATGRTASVENIKVITDLKSRDGETDSLLYVVNFDDEEGFVLVPIPRIEKEVLAIVDEGTYDPAIGSDNPGFNLYLEAANNYIKDQVIEGNINEEPIGGISPQYEITPVDPGLAQVYKEQTDTLAEYGNFHRLGELAWGQHTPYNKYTPNGITGCAPTAMAMIITGIGSTKTHLEYTFPERDVAYEDINWINLLYHKRNHPLDINYNHICYSPNKEASHNSIARLIRQIGVIAKTSYPQNKPSGTNKSNYESTLKFFLPDRDVTKLTDYKSDQVTHILDWGFLLMRADGNNGNHAWVAEGYYFLKTRYRLWERNIETLGWILKKDLTNVLSVTYFNWGWDGEYNGFYDGVVFDPTPSNHFYKPQYIGVSYKH